MAEGKHERTVREHGGAGAEHERASREQGRTPRDHVAEMGLSVGATRRCRIFETGGFYIYIYRSCHNWSLKWLEKFSKQF